MQSLLNGRTLELVLLDLLQQLAIVVIDIQVEIPFWSPLPRRQEERSAIDAPVTQNAEQCTTSIFRRGELHPNVLHMLKGVCRQDLGLDIPGALLVSASSQQMTVREAGLTMAK